MLKISKQLPKEVWVGWISSLVEAYNMAIYSFLAPLLAPLLFHQMKALVAVIFSYSLVFISSCLLYPLGAIYFGLIGDKKGRQKTCIYSTLGLALATGLMGLVPFYEMEGYIWICFLVFICIQYFFSGGEYHGSIVFSLEHSEGSRPGLMSAMSCLFAVGGIVAANGMATLSFLWEDEKWIRLCFFIGAAGGLVSYFLKNHCRESPSFAALPEESLKGIKWSEFIKTEWRTIGTVVAVMAFFLVSYTFIFFVLPLVHLEEGANQSFDTFKSLIGYGVMLVAAGMIADRIGLQKVMAWGIALFSVAIIPLCYLVNNLFVLQMALTACASLVIGPIHSWMLQQFEVNKRCRGIFVSSAIAVSLFSGSAVPICLMMFEESHSLVVCSFYPLTVALASLGCLAASRMRTHRQREWSF